MKKYIFKEVKSIDFNVAEIAKYASFTQSDIFEQWQNYIGYKSQKFVVEKNNNPIAYFYLFQFPLINNKSYAYIPYGPVTKDFSSDFLIELKDTLIQYSKRNNIAFVRLDFMPKIEGSTLEKIFKKSPKFSYHSAHFQPRVEWYLDLKSNEETLLQNMHKNTRYSIRSADKRGISVEIVKNNFMKYFEDFYRLMEITSKRNGFNLHPKKYYEGVFNSLSKDGSEHYLTIARYNDKILSFALIIVHEKVANYVFGCTSNEERNRFPAYAGLWRSITHAKTIGCDFFNFGAITSDDMPNSHLASLTDFKKKFGGIEIHHSDFYDIVINPVLYYLFILRKWLKHK